MREAAGPDDEVAIDETGGATVVEASGEEDDDAFPGSEDGGAKGEHGEEAKVALEDLLFGRGGQGCR